MQVFLFIQKFSHLSNLLDVLSGGFKPLDIAVLQNISIVRICSNSLSRLSTQLFKELDVLLEEFQFLLYLFFLLSQDIWIIRVFSIDKLLLCRHKYILFVMQRCLALIDKTKIANGVLDTIGGAHLLFLSSKIGLDRIELHGRFLQVVVEVLHLAQVVQEFLLGRSMIFLSVASAASTSASRH